MGGEGVAAAIDADRAWALVLEYWRLVLWWARKYAASCGEDVEAVAHGLAIDVVLRLRRLPGAVEVRPGLVRTLVRRAAVDYVGRHGRESRRAFRRWRAGVVEAVGRPVRRRAPARVRAVARPRMDLAERLGVVRTVYGLDLTTVARELGRSEAVARRWARGRVSAAAAPRLEAWLAWRERLEREAAGRWPSALYAALG